MVESRQIEIQFLQNNFMEEWKLLKQVLTQTNSVFLFIYYKRICISHKNVRENVKCSHVINFRS